MVEQQWFETNLRTDSQDFHNFVQVPVVFNWGIIFNTSFEDFAINKSYKSTSDWQIYEVVQCNYNPGFKVNPHLLHGCQCKFLSSNTQTHAQTLLLHIDVTEFKINNNITKLGYCM